MVSTRAGLFLSALALAVGSAPASGSPGAHVGAGGFVSFSELAPMLVDVVDPTPDSYEGGSGVVLVARVFPESPITNIRPVVLTCATIEAGSPGHVLYASGENLLRPGEDWYLTVWDRGGLDFDMYDLRDYPTSGPCGGGLGTIFTRVVSPLSFHIMP